MEPSRELLILALDHRGSFKKKFLGAPDAPLSPDLLPKAQALKRIIYDGFERAIADGIPREKAALLVDEEMGEAILRDATRKGYTVLCPAERSGQEEFEFEYADWQEHIRRIDPTFCKVLVRYNVEGDAALNRRQAARLRMLGDFLRELKKEFLFELIVPPTEAQLQRAGGQGGYDDEIRPGLMVGAITELLAAGVEPDVWKLEGVGRAEDARALVVAARAGGRQTAIVTLGRGESKQKVAEWVKVGVHIDGIIGFAIGRTIFSDALSSYQAQALTVDQTVQAIADTYREFVDLWEAERVAV